MLYLDILQNSRMDVDPGVSPLEMARKRTNASFSIPQGGSPLDKDPFLSGSDTPKASESSPSSDVVEDEVDQALWQQDGAIQRPKDERM